MEGARGCSGPREQHTPRGDVAVAPRPPVHDGSSGDAGGLLELLPANTAHEPTEHQRFLLQAGRAQEAVDFLGGLQKVPNDSGFEAGAGAPTTAAAVASAQVVVGGIDVAVASCAPSVGCIRGALSCSA